MVSPRFLMREEFAQRPMGQDGVSSELARNMAIANRMSYFVWASMPDDRLFQAAREGRLVDPAGRLAETRRMMADPRSRALSTQFGMQWLKLHKVASVAPDRKRFPAYYRAPATMPPVSLSMMIEQLLLLKRLVLMMFLYALF